MVTFHDPGGRPGQKAPWYPWPYVEGLTDRGGDQRARLHRHRASTASPCPSRTARRCAWPLPWKYGFKSTKGLVRFEFTDERPVSFWEEIQPSEYGFWANVNPEVPHPRWSQATETGARPTSGSPTLLYNGYGEEVADLYTGLEGEKLYM